MQIKPNVALWVALAIPVVVILAVSALIYWPRSGVTEPTYNFLYSLRDYSDDYSYTVSNGVLTRELIRTDEMSKRIPTGTVSQTHFFVHDVTSNESKEVSFEEAAQLKLNSNLTAPDGYELRRGSSNGGVFPFFFDNNNYDKQYLVLKNYAKEVHVKRSSDYNYQPFELIGWIQE